MTPYRPTLKHDTAGANFPPAAFPRVTTMRLKKKDQAEVLGFLSERPLHNVVMSGFLRDNGIESELNRGIFYGARDEANRLQGVALIGHATFIDARREAVIPQFAHLAHAFPHIHMLLSECELVEHFWRLYAPAGQRLRRRGREILCELNRAPLKRQPVPELRFATAADLLKVAAVQASLAQQESGVNPLRQDRAGFLARCQQRIERDRVWTLIRNGELIFKADVISETPEAIYLEGVYVNPTYRNKGVGSACLAELAGRLLNHANSIVIFVNENRPGAHRFFQRAGFVARGAYETLFFFPAVAATLG